MWPHQPPLASALLHECRRLTPLGLSANPDAGLMGKTASGSCWDPPEDRVLATPSRAIPRLLGKGTPGEKEVGGPHQRKHSSCDGHASVRQHGGPQAIVKPAHPIEALGSVPSSKFSHVLRREVPQN
jgi:hypothetical protein